MLPNLKQLRKESAISQQKLADAIGVSQQSINQYENHSVEPDISVLCRMADYFGTSIDYIVGRTDNPMPIEMLRGEDATAEERRLQHNFRHLSLREREMALRLIAVLKDMTENEGK